MKAATRRRRLIYAALVALLLFLGAFVFISRPLPSSEIDAALKATILPRLTLHNATLEEAVDEILSQAAAQNPQLRRVTKYVYRDPEPVGVAAPDAPPLVPIPGTTEPRVPTPDPIPSIPGLDPPASNAPTPDASPAIPGLGSQPVIPDGNELPLAPLPVGIPPQDHVTVDLANIPASEALNYVCGLLNFGWTTRPGTVGFFPMRYVGTPFLPPLTPMENAKLRWKLFIKRVRYSFGFGWDYD
jgi:hypothetical protein